MRSMAAYTYIALRLLVGIIFAAHGKFKLDWGYANLAEWLGTQGFPLAVLLGYLLPWIELVGGLLVIAGLGTRYIASAFSLILLAALLKVKLSVGFISGTATGYEFDLLLLAVCVHVALTARGSWRAAWMIRTEGGETSNV